mmetsp:Transcript_35794/g.75374  ORF Transcript_35794/g.75374 Transcript_35794/m.75374 type:complete len:346 (-) Transcript_35794:285-1322(-)|eukprot:CAMPEP_0183735190 /NCGR_PEP_ID=MMETSP0737-20130205/45955_1 /TAXON_ID=385413 /ORGANISM="Thalassiosira miniscula, Strain CCMP1093" /LENGTH=345 /DNA_ID=CAMNT_0025968857 /DNA_START=343 /DNA_END=1380 /DNA_ORIENTATION=-
MGFDKPPRKIVHYPIPGDAKGGALLLYGSENAKHMALMSAGFPNDHNVFVPFAFRLAKEADTLVGLTCLPGYDDRKDKPWVDHKKNKRDGYSLDEMAICVGEAAKALRAESTCPTKAKFTGIFHDWGVVAGSLWSNRAIADGSDILPDDLVYFDVLAPPHPSTPDLPADDAIPSFGRLLVRHFYQYVLAFSFAAQRYIGDRLAIMILLGGMIPTALGLRLASKHDEGARKMLGSPNISHLIYMGYPYYHMIFSTSIMNVVRWKIHKIYTMPQDLSKVPVLYMYGTEKATKFHTDQSVKVLQREQDEKRGKSKAVAVDGAGHWLYKQKADECFNCVVEFMKEDTSV